LSMVTPSDFAVATWLIWTLSIVIVGESARLLSVQGRLWFVEEKSRDSYFTKKMVPKCTRKLFPRRKN